MMQQALVQVKTPFAIILHSGTVLSPATSLERVISTLQSTDVSILGGLVYRHASHAIDLPCHTLRVSQYTLQYRFGSRSRQRDVRTCDRVSDAFAVRVAQVRDALEVRDDLDTAEGWLTSLFLRAKAAGHAVGASPTLQFDADAARCAAPPPSAEELDLDMHTLGREVRALWLERVLCCVGGWSEGGGGGGGGGQEEKRERGAKNE